MERARCQFVDRARQRRSLVGHDLFWFAMRVERGREELSGGSQVAAGRDVDVDDLTVLVDGPIHVPPPACDLHVGLVHEPTATDRVSAWSRRIRQ